MIREILINGLSWLKKLIYLYKSTNYTHTLLIYELYYLCMINVLYIVLIFKILFEFTCASIFLFFF